METGHPSTRVVPSGNRAVVSKAEVAVNVGQNVSAEVQQNTPERLRSHDEYTSHHLHGDVSIQVDQRFRTTVTVLLHRLPVDRQSAWVGCSSRR